MTAIPFRASKAKRYAEVTLHYSPVPRDGGGAAYLSALDDLPKGWTLAAWEHVDPDHAKPPLHGEGLVAALDDLIAEAQRFRAGLMDLIEVNSEDGWHDLDRKLQAVDDAMDRLPDPEDEDA